MEKTVDGIVYESVPADKDNTCLGCIAYSTVGLCEALHGTETNEHIACSDNCIIWNVKQVQTPITEKSEVVMPDVNDRFKVLQNITIHEGTVSDVGKFFIYDTALNRYISTDVTEWDKADDDFEKNYKTAAEKGYCIGYGSHIEMFVITYNPEMMTQTEAEQTIIGWDAAHKNLNKIYNVNLD